MTNGGGDTAVASDDDDLYTMTIASGGTVTFEARYLGPLLQLVSDFADEYNIGLGMITKDIVAVCLRVVMDDDQ